MLFAQKNGFLSVFFFFLHLRHMFLTGFVRLSVSLVYSGVDACVCVCVCLSFCWFWYPDSQFSFVKLLKKKCFIMMGWSERLSVHHHHHHQERRLWFNHTHTHTHLQILQPSWSSVCFNITSLKITEAHLRHIRKQLCSGKS